VREGNEVAALVDDRDVHRLPKVVRLGFAADDHAARVFEIDRGLLQHDMNSLCPCSRPCETSEFMQRVVNATSRNNVITATAFDCRRR
jgi:hypothetical protein